ncbi:TPA: hypothetical protein MDM46_001275 [Klebsiella pneumoniae]|nr:hypothetical protein [Klebsiella pneumoniae]HBV0705853.1 hypothetical protein [Klebsiella pneumoniae]
MSLTKEDLVFDLYYASSTDEEGNKLAQLTVQFRDPSAVPHVTTQLARTTFKRDRSKVYAVGEQSVKNGSDTLLAAIEAYYRTDPKTIFENLMAQVQDMIEGNLGANNTWVGSYGITIVSGGSLEEYLPESVYNVQ